MFKQSILAFMVALACGQSMAADYYVVAPVKGKTVNTSAISVVLSSGALPGATAGQAYSYDLKSGLQVTGDAKYTGFGVNWSLASGSLPAGLSLSSAGVLSGIPSAPGSVTLGVKATYLGVPGVGTYTLAVASGAVELTIAGSGARTWADGSRASSCLGYLSPTAPYSYAGAGGDGAYEIVVNGTVRTVTCNMTDGGWTQVARATGSAQSFSTTTIDDLGLAYTEVLASAGAAHFANYSVGNPTFKFVGFSPIEGLRFGTTWYFKATTIAWRGYGASQSSPYGISLPGGAGWANSNYTTVTANAAGSSCIFGSTPDSTACAQKVKIAVPSGQRLTGYNDLESLDGRVTDNAVVRDLTLYVR